MDGPREEEEYYVGRPGVSYSPACVCMCVQAQQILFLSSPPIFKSFSTNLVA